MIKKLINLLHGHFISYLYTQEERIRKNGGKVGKSVFFGKDVFIDYDYAFLLEICDGAVIAARSIVELHDSSLPNVLGHAKNKIGRIKIGKRAYIGVNSVILPGVEIGDGALVGACSLVNRDIPSGEVWGGIPASYICTVDELAAKRETDSKSNVAHFDWIGELEKQNINYQVFKKDFLKTVKYYFLELSKSDSDLSKKNDFKK